MDCKITHSKEIQHDRNSSIMFIRHSEDTKAFSKKQSGFSKWDALCMTGVLSILLLLATSATGNSRWTVESQAARCRMNLKLLQQAFQFYAWENENVLVLNGDNEFASWVKSIMNFNGGNLFNRSAKSLMDPSLNLLAPYTKDAYIYRCPADKSRVLNRGKSYLRVRSVSLSGAMGTGVDGDPVFNTWLPAFAGWKVFSRLSELEMGPPSQLITFMVEHPDSINDGNYSFEMPGDPSNFPNFNSTTRWVDFPASFHNGGDSIAFADGSVLTRYWEDERSVVGPTYGGGILTTPSQRNNVDILWMAARISRPDN